MSFWRLYYHVVWGTKDRLPTLDDELAAVAERSIRATARDMGLIFHGIGVMPEHVHLVIGVPPRHSIAGVLKQVKGSSSHLLGSVANSGAESSWFGWQREYGVLSFGERSFDQVLRYVENQRQHHQAGDLMHLYEMVEQPQVPPVRTATPGLPGPPSPPGQPGPSGPPD